MKSKQSPEALRDSIYKTVEFLDTIIEAPQHILGNSEARAALGSQGQLAAYSDRTLGIISMSINTQKKYADLVLPLGFQGLNRQRCLAQKQMMSIGNNSASSKSRRKNIEIEKLKLLRLQSAVMNLTQINSELRSICLAIINNEQPDPSLYCAIRLAEIDSGDF